MAKFASGYIASGNIPPVIAELLSDAEKVEDRKFAQASSIWCPEHRIKHLFLIV
jgi:hypothetical protein